MTEHVLDDLEAYALGALDDASAGLVAAHLAACPSCRAEAASLADVVGALPDSVLLREPRPALRERVLAAARAGTRGSEPASHALTSERESYSEVVQSLRQGARVWYMAGKDDFSGSGGTLFDPRAEGKQPFVLFHDLPPIAAGKVLTIWLVSPEGTWARAATFVPDGRDVQAVPINTEVAGFDRCAVTLDDSPWGKHGTVVMESRIAPPTAAP